MDVFYKTAARVERLKTLVTLGIKISNWIDLLKHYAKLFNQFFKDRVMECIKFLKASFHILISMHNF